MTNRQRLLLELGWRFAVLIILALFAYEVKKLYEPKMNVKNIQSYAENIQIILSEKHNEPRLNEVWPNAGAYMDSIARVNYIEWWLLPCISRAEGPSEEMIRLKNPYGLTQDGKTFLKYDSFESSTNTATMLLCKFRHKYFINGKVDIELLARWYCPFDPKWVSNMKSLTKGLQ